MRKFNESGIAILLLLLSAFAIAVWPESALSQFNDFGIIRILSGDILTRPSKHSIWNDTYFNPGTLELENGKGTLIIMNSGPNITVFRVSDGHQYTTLQTQLGAALDEYGNISGNCYTEALEFRFKEDKGPTLIIAAHCEWGYTIVNTFNLINGLWYIGNRYQGRGYVILSYSGIKVNEELENDDRTLAAIKRIDRFK
ncbi:MAG: hypothetical protein WCJ64_01990 [Rhodospirillaceae bacterium]